MKLFIFVVVLAFIFISVAVSKTPKISNKVVEDYIESLARAPESQEKENLEEHFNRLFKDFKVGATEEIIRDTYAEDFYFNDTFKTFASIEELVPYMVETAQHVEVTEVEILDIAKSDTDYYVRWVMDMKFKAKWKKVNSKSTGITQLRFDSEGKIIFHHDYWDSADGFYQHLPIVGYFVRKTRGML